nr:bifunctional aspartate kinase/homoserine dehydrogenase I [Calditrichia bacterium]
LILAREVGIMAEPAEVRIGNILPQSCLEAPDVDTFFRELARNEALFRKMLDPANAAGQKLRFTGSVSGEQLSVSLRSVGPDHPFYGLSGSDNMIAISSRRYRETPLVIRGPGAGADVTAAGVFGDVLTIGGL